MRQCEFKIRYDPDMDMYVKKHIHGEGTGDVFKAIGSKIFRKTAKTAATKAMTTAATKTGEYAGKKAGDKIVELLSKKSSSKTDKPSEIEEIIVPPVKPTKKSREITAKEVNDRVNQIISGGKHRRRIFI